MVELVAYTGGSTYDIPIGKEYELFCRSNEENYLLCPICSDDRRKKNIKCLGYNLSKAVGKCNHCAATFSRIKEKPQKMDFKPLRIENDTQLPEKVLDYLKSRKISQKTANHFNVYYTKYFFAAKGQELPCLGFPYKVNNLAINVQFRTRDKDFGFIKGAPRVIYNLDAVKDSDTVIWVEGPMDVLALYECGIENVVSVPNGSTLGKQNLDYLDEYVHLFENKKHILALDNDKAGNLHRDELARRLGYDICSTVTFLDCKDANDCLIKYDAKIVHKCIEEAKEYPIVGVFTASDIDAEIEDYYINGLPEGHGIGIPSVDSLVKFHLGYITIITAIPNHGKSEWIDFIACRLNVLHGWKFAFYSPENHPLQLHFSKLAEKLIGKSFTGQYKMNETEKNIAKKYVQDNFFFIAPEEDNSLDNILMNVKQLIKRKGISAYVLDPWNKLSHAETTTDYISITLDKIINFNKRNNIHCFLVAHPTKIQKDKNTGLFEVPNLYNISGSAHFFNKADIGLTVYLNRNSNEFTIFTQKIKFKHWGSVGQVSLDWDFKNGRYYDRVKDDTNWITQKPLQLEIKEEYLPIKGWNFYEKDNDDPPF